jgi:hypothetical protein
MMHGTLSCCIPCLTTTLARFFTAVRFDRRPSGVGRVGITLPWRINFKLKWPSAE